MDYNQLADFCHAELVGGYCRDSAMSLYGGFIAGVLLCAGFVAGTIIGIKYGRQSGYREGRENGFSSGVKAVQDNPNWPISPGQNRDEAYKAFAADVTAWRDSASKLKSKSRP